MPKISQKFISILIALAFLLALQTPAFSNVKVDFADEIATDFESNNNEDSKDKELKFGNNQETQIFLTTHRVMIDAPSDTSRTTFV